ncbi:MULTISPECIES: hypothetical protein [unclassified Ensifer]|uniref:hypothetical protein n=1 Tax=unclassified Ensifer TaxID=2633371 RepID=UPI0007110EAB|nr:MULTISPECIES: hypothetical protein [unclassified Ensifer]KQW47226.1 hypothetical protein ASD02_34455 [Ensifer sp. Root1252]KRC68778.1 hypothetical protein ASE32_35285 [Ensifer sp. Root231]KRC93944.1 hypothetical protein ASE47_34950 [Ensifer sp. Root258]
MSLDERTLSASLVDVRHAYRLLWDFQRRCLDTLKHVAQQFPERQFYQWQNNVVGAVPPARSDPMDSWAWSFLPCYNMSVLYARGGDGRAHPKVGDWLLEVRIVTDTGWDLADQRIEPDPSRFISVESADSKLSIIAFKCVADVDPNDNWFHHVWGNASWPEDEVDQDGDGIRYLAEDPLVACQLDIPLSSLTTKDAVRAFCDRAKQAISDKLLIRLEAVR